MENYDYKPISVGRWKWWCRLRNHWRRGEQSMFSIGKSTYCEWCGNEVKDSLWNA